MKVPYPECISPNRKLVIRRASCILSACSSLVWRIDLKITSSTRPTKKTIIRVSLSKFPKVRSGIRYPVRMVRYSPSPSRKPKGNRENHVGSDVFHGNSNLLKGIPLMNYYNCYRDCKGTINEDKAIKSSRKKFRH